MLRLLTVTTVLIAVAYCAETPAGNLWTDLKAKRAALPGAHQEFEVSQIFQSAHSAQSLDRKLVVDLSQQRWRETSISGTGTRIRIFNGADVFSMDEGGDEFVRLKRRDKDEDPAPHPYSVGNTDWSKASELERRSCGLPGREDMCAVLQAPLKPWGSERVVIDVETGLILSVRTVTQIVNGTKMVESEATYLLKRFRVGSPNQPGLFKLPDDMHEVKELSRWNAAKIKKQLAGKTAPELKAVDLLGNQVALSNFKGKTVLLDFWTTWCPPCRADAPALDKLYRKYGEDLMVVGISVSEDRAIVQKFLKEHPHAFPVVLTSENEMPRAYQIGVFPTYIVIDREGKLTSAVEGDQGFGELRKLLKKAGMEVD